MIDIKNLRRGAKPKNDEDEDLVAGLDEEEKEEGSDLTEEEDDEEESGEEESY